MGYVCLSGTPPRAKNGVGLIVTGGIAPNRRGRLSPVAAKMSNMLEVRQ